MFRLARLPLEIGGVSCEQEGRAQSLSGVAGYGLMRCVSPPERPVKDMEMK